MHCRIIFNHSRKIPVIILKITFIAARKASRSDNYIRLRIFRLREKYKFSNNQTREDVKLAKKSTEVARIVTKIHFVWRETGSIVLIVHFIQGEGMKIFHLRTMALLMFIMSLLTQAQAADTVSVAMASTRVRFTVQEPVELVVQYANDGGNVTNLPLVITHHDGTALTIAVPVQAAQGKAATQVVTINAGILKPGDYQATVSGATAPVSFAIYPAEHTNAFYTGDWVHHGWLPGTIIAKGGLDVYEWRSG